MAHIYQEHKYADPLLKKKIVFNWLDYRWVDHERSHAKSLYLKYKEIDWEIKEESANQKHYWEDEECKWKRK